MNRKGFTLIELLATIVIISIIGGIATIAYTSFINQAADRSFKSYQDTMHAEAAYYLSNNYSKVSFVNNKARLTLSELQVDNINNPKDGSDLCLNSYVDIKRTYVGSVPSITYNVCLKCKDYDNCREYEN